jgi:hypothetical protein
MYAEGEEIEEQKEKENEGKDESGIVRKIKELRKEIDVTVNATLHELVL